MGTTERQAEKKIMSHVRKDLPSIPKKPKVPMELKTSNQNIEMINHVLGQ